MSSFSGFVPNRLLFGSPRTRYEREWNDTNVTLYLRNTLPRQPGAKKLLLLNRRVSRFAIRNRAVFFPEPRHRGGLKGRHTHDGHLLRRVPTICQPQIEETPAPRPVTTHEQTNYCRGVCQHWPSATPASESWPSVGCYAQLIHLANVQLSKSLVYSRQLFFPPIFRPISHNNLDVQNKTRHPPPTSIKHHV